MGETGVHKQNKKIDKNKPKYLFQFQNKTKFLKYFKNQNKDKTEWELYYIVIFKKSILFQGKIHGCIGNITQVFFENTLEY